MKVGSIKPRHMGNPPGGKVNKVDLGTCFVRDSPPLHNYLPGRWLWPLGRLELWDVSSESKQEDP